jgi:hypothetical protein
MIMVNVSDLENQINQLKQTIDTLSKKVERLSYLFENHKHSGNDNSKLLNSFVPISASRLDISYQDNVIGKSLYIPQININSSGENNITRTSFLASIVTGKGTNNEMVVSIIGAGRSNISSEDAISKSINIDGSDFDMTNISQLEIINLTALKARPKYSFVRATSILFNGSGFLTNGSNILYDPNLKLTPANKAVSIDNNDINGNSPPRLIVGSIVFISVPNSSLAFDAKIVTNNTENTITLNSNWTYPSGTYEYIVFAPVFLGSADMPFRRLYVADDSNDVVSGGRSKDIRLGIGPSNGSGVIWICHGSGSPEGVVTANVGSIYLRTDSGSFPKLYVKESGTGNTGWVGK